MEHYRVLVVDDDELQRRVCSVDLVAEGFVVRTAATTDEALEHVHRFRPHLIILDVVMPGRDGFECLRALKLDDTLSDIPVVMLTARDEIDDELQGIAGGADRYLTKPVHRDLLVQTVRSMLSPEHQG